MTILTAALAFTVHYSQTLAENKRLTSELETANATILALDQVVKAHNEIRENERNLIDAIEATPDSADAPTAPVLLDAIGRLHQP
ncbi:MAG: hypothetical protein ACPGQQ_08195 [Candidatus Puniceispirillaceae bacterium]